MMEFEWYDICEIDELSNQNMLVVRHEHWIGDVLAETCEEM